jgi:hypothetical protein
MPTQRRIFWTTQEKKSVLATARQLRDRQPRLTLKQIGTKAQGTLQKQRRRPVNNKLTSWLSTELKGGAAPIRGPHAKTVKRASVATPAEQSSVVQTLIEHGAAILSGILRHPSVRKALGSTLPGRVSRKR